MATPFVKEPAYGAKGEMDRLQKSALVAGSQGASSALNTPRRSQRQAVAGKSAQAPVAAGGEPLAAQPQPAAQQPVELPYATRVLAVWEEIASYPEASPLARRMAEAARGPGAAA